MKVIFAAYRAWAFKILDILVREKDKGWKIGGIITTESCEIDLEDYSKDIPVICRKLDEIKDDKFGKKLSSCQPDLILFYGWSWLVKRNIRAIAPCICLHPSPLPKYRGGSPIQHQIIAGEKESAVTLFFLDEGIDSGSIVAQKTFSLDGEMDEILERIIAIGAELTEKTLDGLTRKSIIRDPQDNSQATVYKRRKPRESEITIGEISSNPAEYIYNKIRALQSPYPHAYIVCGDGKKVYLTKAHL